MRDVVVIGAGPAGSITARILAEAGRDVLVLEEHDVIGAPVHCTGLLGFDAFDEFDLPRDLILGRAGAARLVGRRRSIGDGPQRASGSRGHRPRAGSICTLARRAEHAGAEVRTGCRVESISVGPRSVSVTGRGFTGVVEARACVLACGASYRFHRQLGLGMPEVFLQSAQLETPCPDVPQIEVRFGQAVAPGGFAWLVPLQRDRIPYARIGLMANAHSRDRFDTFLSWLSAENGVGAPGARSRISRCCRSVRSRAPTAIAWWPWATPPGS